MSQRKIEKYLEALQLEKNEYTGDELDLAEEMPPRKFISLTYDSRADITEEDIHAYEDELEDGGCPSHLDSVDGHEHITPVILHKGASLFMSFLQNHDIDYLYLSSECGLYQGMTEYIAQIRDQIKNNQLSEIELKSKLNELDALLDRFAMLYWTSGYIEASKIHYELSRILKNSATQELKDLSSTQVEKAMKDYVKAELLKDNPHSTEIDKVIYEDVSPTELDWNLEKAKPFFEKVFPDKTRRAALEKEAIKELRTLAEDNHTLKFRSSK